MSNRRLSFDIPRDIRFAYGYVQTAPAPKAKPTGNHLWNAKDVADDVAAITRAKLYEQTRARLESDLDRARQAGDFGKVNRIAALLTRLTLAR